MSPTARPCLLPEAVPDCDRLQDAVYLQAHKYEISLLVGHTAANMTVVPMSLCTNSMSDSKIDDTE